MADIVYNGLGHPENIVTFTNVPNILKVRDYDSGSKATLTFSFNGDLRSTVTGDSQYHITLLGEVVTNVMSPSNSSNKRFYISDDSNSTAMNVAKALRNCSGLSAEFNIIHNGNSVTLIAKAIGKKWTLQRGYLSRNIPTQYLTVSAYDGTSSSVLFGSKINADIYSGDSADNNSYITTLEKNFYGDECAFNVTQVLSTFSEFGRTVPYYISLDVTTQGGEYQHIGEVTGFTTPGYLANESDKFLVADDIQFLINNRRGTNGSVLYTYSNTINYSILRGTSTGGWSYSVTARDSTNNQIWQSGTGTRRGTSSSNLIYDLSTTIPAQVFTNAYYIDVTEGSSTVRFNVIKPLKATEYYQRVLWRNEYGGISFFDFTGSRSETDNVDIETYEKNVFDYYDTDEYEKKRIYKNDYNKTVKLTSHLMEEDGKWIFNSLMRSKRVWTVVNGKTFYIIPRSVDVAEDGTYNNIYTATLNYEYSDLG